MDEPHRSPLQLYWRAGAYAGAWRGPKRREPSQWLGRGGGEAGAAAGAPQRPIGTVPSRPPHWLYILEGAEATTPPA